MSLGTLTIDIAANLARLEADLGRANHMAERSMRQIERAATVAATALGAIGAGLALGSFAAYMRNAGELAEQIGQVAEQSGITVESLSALKFAAEQNDTSFTTLADSLKKLRISQVAAQQGNEKMLELFEKIGVSAADLEKLRPEDLFFRIADAVKALGTEEERTYLLSKLMGKSADELGILMNQGAAGIRNAMQEARTLGVVLNDETVAATKAANDNILALQASAESLGITMLANVAPSMKNITDAMREAAKESGVLMALFVGLGGALQEVLNASELKSVTNEIEFIQQRMAALQKQADQPEGFFNNAGIKQARVELSSYGQQLERLESRRNALLPAPAGAPSPSKPGPSGKPLTLIEPEFHFDQAALDIDSLLGKIGEIPGAVEEVNRLLAEAAEKGSLASAGAAERAMGGLYAAAEANIKSVEEFLKSDEERLKDQYEERLKQLEEYHGSAYAEEERFQEARKNLDERYEKDRRQLELEKRTVLLSNSAAIFDGLAGIAEASVGKQSGAYKALFAISKAFAIADAIVKIQAGIAGAATAPWPTNLAAMASVVAATSSIVSTIKSTNLVGVAHGGMDNIPREGTYLLDGGERVVSPQQNRDLTEFLQGGKNQGLTVNIIESGRRAGEVQQNGNEITVFVARVREAVAQDILSGGNNIARAVEGTYGLNRSAGARR